MFCLFVFSGFARADCLGGEGVFDIVISDEAYVLDDVVTCVTMGGITLGPTLTIPDGVVFDLISPSVTFIGDVEAVSGSQLSINTRMRPLNDTGIFDCADGSSNDLSCPQGLYPFQDAEYGRDFTHDDDSDGHAGFSFTKVDSAGDPLAANAGSWSCVKDEVTGLVWEVKTADGLLHDKDHTYTWFNPDNATNGGSVGTEDFSGATCSLDEFCDTTGFVDAVNSNTLCGASDWRMPTRAELESLVSFDRYFPSIDATYFPNTPWALFWTATPMAGNVNGAMRVSFGDGGSNGILKSDARSIRLVRGGGN
jgi:hypothetical protein